MLAAGHSVLSLSFRSFFFRRLISEVAWPIIIKLYHKFDVSSPPPKFGGPKTSKFRRDFAQFRDLFANISGTQQDIVDLKTALQTTDTPAQADLIRCTLVHKRAKNRTGVLTHPTGGHQTGHRHASSLIATFRWSDDQRVTQYLVHSSISNQLLASAVSSAQRSVICFNSPDLLLCTGLRTADCSASGRRSAAT